MDVKALPSDIDTQFAGFQALLDAQKRTVIVNLGDSRILKTVLWLLTMQRPSGAWGNDDVATTSVAMLALLELADSTSNTDLRTQIANAIKKAAAFLVSKFSINNWENALWDTSVATRALFRSHYDQYQSFIQSRVDWITRASEKRGNHGPHHLAQAIITLAETGVHRDLLINRAEYLSATINDNPANYSPYVIGQCIEALCRIEAITDSTTKSIDYICAYLSTVRLDFANFLNICYALQSLWLAPGKDNMRTARVGTASLFGNTCFRDTGSWYNSELFTAWALLTLARFSEEVIVRLPYSEALFEYSKLKACYREHAAVLATQHRHRLALNVAAAITWSGLIVYFVYYTTRNNDMWEWAKWVIWAFIVALVGFNLRQIIRKGGE